MTWQRWRILLVGPVVASLWHGLNTPTATGQIHHHRYRTRSERSIRPYAYQHDDERFIDRVLAVAEAGPPTEIELPGVPKDGKATRKIVRQKQFVPQSATLDVKHVRLDRISLTLDDSGRATCTAQITHNETNTDIQGDRVIIRIRAFAGVPRHANVDAGAPMLWETTRSLWVSRGERKMISLLPGERTLPHIFGGQTRVTSHDDCCVTAKIEEHFQNITHLELDLEYGRERVASATDGTNEQG